MSNLEYILVIYIALNWLMTLIIGLIPSGKLSQTVMIIVMTILNPLLVIGYAEWGLF